jgi:hypothetical protein
MQATVSIIWLEAVIALVHFFHRFRVCYKFDGFCLTNWQNSSNLYTVNLVHTVIIRPSRSTALEENEGYQHQ